MPFEEDVSNFFSNAKWKITQQAQILKMQAEMTDLEHKISVQKTVLGEKAYESFEQGGINTGVLIPVCLKIQELYAQKAQMQRDLDTFRQQDDPADKSAPTPPSPAAASESSMEAVDSFEDEAPSPSVTAPEDDEWQDAQVPGGPADV